MYDETYIDEQEEQPKGKFIDEQAELEGEYEECEFVD